MFGLGMTEIMIISIVLILIVGPKQFPKMARSIGEAMKIIKKLPEEMEGLDED